MRMLIRKAMLFRQSISGTILLLWAGSMVSGYAQTRAFLFNNGVNYMLADKQKAIEQFSKAIAIDSAFGAAYFYRGVARFKLGRYTQAIDDFNRVLQLDTTLKIVNMYKGFAYRQLGMQEESLQAFNSYLQSKDSLTSLDYNIIGKANLEAGDLDAAIGSFSKALQDNTSEAQYYYLFLAYFNKKEYDKAVQQINRAIAENENFYGYYLNRGSARLMMGRFEQALHDYNHALRLEPNVPDSYFLRGRVLDTLRQHNLAIRDFTKAIELNPTDGTYYSKRGNARYAIGNREGACLDWTIANQLGYYEDFDKVKSLCE